MSIENFLKEYAEKNPSRWHTPGHKGRLNPLDITELADGSFPGEYVKIAERKAAGFFGSAYCRFLTNGSSQGIKAAILAAGGDIIAADNCHRAVQEGANLAKVNLFHIQTSACTSDYALGISPGGLPYVPTLEQVQTAIKTHPRAKAVYLESPNYFGFVIDPAIPQAVKDAGMLFFCDAAHGAHFPAHKGLFPKSYSGVADVCNLSAHKTLNACTQTAYLCVNNSVLTEKIDKALNDLGTTSPSYILLASLETAIEAAQKNQKAYERLFQDVQYFKNEINCLKNDDFTRLVVPVPLFGEDVYGRLKQTNIYAELYQGCYAVFIATPHERRTDFEKLANVMKDKIIAK